MSEAIKVEVIYFDNEGETDTFAFNVNTLAECPAVGDLMSYRNDRNEKAGRRVVSRTVWYDKDTVAYITLKVGDP